MTKIIFCIPILNLLVLNQLIHSQKISPHFDEYMNKAPEQFEIKGKTSEELLTLITAYQQAINVNIISSITDASGTILYANDKFCEVSKYSRNELIGQNHRIINSGFHTTEFFSEMWKTLKKGSPWLNEIKNKAKDGSLYWVDTVILPIMDKEGKIIQYLSLRTLITEKKQAEEEKREYSLTLKEMLYMTSHRVRSPLVTCLGLMQLLEKREMNGNAESQKIIHHLKSSALELDAFTKELTIFMSELEKKYKSKIE